MIYFQTRQLWNMSFGARQPLISLFWSFLMTTPYLDIGLDMICLSFYLSDLSNPRFLLVRSEQSKLFIRQIWAIQSFYLSDLSNPSFLFVRSEPASKLIETNRTLFLKRAVTSFTLRGQRKTDNLRNLNPLSLSQEKGKVLKKIVKKLEPPLSFSGERESFEEKNASRVSTFATALNPPTHPKLFVLV